MTEIRGREISILSFMWLGLAFVSIFKLYTSNPTWQAQGMVLIISMQCLILSKLYSKGENK